MKRMAQGFLLSLLFFMFCQPQILSQNIIQPGSVLLTHISPDYGAAGDEFVVLYNASVDTIDLAGHEVRYFTASGSPGSAGRSFVGMTLIPPHGYLLLSPNDTVTVGMVSVLRDDPFTSGMATTGGQLVLRSSTYPDSIVYAAAWGSVTQFVSGMTDAASWSTDGMIALVWQDSGYVRSSPVFSNTQYEHIPSDSILFLPSQAGPAISRAGIQWSISVAVVQGPYSDSSIVLGMDGFGTDGFDYLLDYPMPPLPAGTFVAAGVHRPDLNLPTGDYLLRDVGPLRSLSDTTMRWLLDVWPAEVGSVVSVSLQLSNVPAYLPVQFHDPQYGTREHRRGDSLRYEFIAATTDPHRFLVIIGDTTPPLIEFSSPAAEERLTVGSEANVLFSIEEQSGIDSLTLFFEDLSGSTVHVVVDTTVRSGTVRWRMPRRLLSDSVRFVLYARDSMNNALVHSSPVFSVVPDTARLLLTSGWHTFSVPLEPVGTDLLQASEDSIYLFEHLQQRGYAPADSVHPGRGYFSGVMSDHSVVLSGIPVIDSLSLQLPVGYSLVSNPTDRTIARNALVLSFGGTYHTYSSAIANGLISNGFFGYDHASGIYLEADSLRPWEAYWIPVLMPDVGMLFAVGGGQGSLRVVEPRFDGWEIRFRAVVNGSSDTLLSLGVNERASDGFDGSFDVPAPPPPPGAGRLQVYADNMEWKTVVGTRFLKDIRSGRGPAEWNIVVSVPEGEGGTLGWQRGLGQVPVGILIRRTSPDAGTWERLNEDWRCTIEGNAENRFTVRMITTGSDDEHPEVPTTFEMMSNYPNPFNGATVLSFSIPVDGTLSVRVFDQLGRLVDVIDDQEYVPGMHSMAWSADISSGVYMGEAIFRPAAVYNGLKIRRWRMVLVK